MRVNQTIMNDRQRVSLHDFKGIDMYSAPSNVALNRATDMSNFIYEDGLVRKRHGWGQVLQIREGLDKFPRINGLFDITLEGKRLFIAYAGVDFYLIVDKKYAKVTTRQFNENGVTGGSVADINKLSGLTDTRCQVFIQGNKAYFVGCGEYAVLGKYGEVFEFRKVYDTDNAYVPTTSIFINHEQTEDRPEPIELDKPNLMTAYRKNRLVGTDVSNYLLNATYRLDSKIAEGSDVKIHIEALANRVVDLHNGSTEISRRTIDINDDLSDKEVFLSLPLSKGYTLTDAVIIGTTSKEMVVTSSITAIDNKTQSFTVDFINTSGKTTLAKYVRTFNLVWGRWQLQDSPQPPASIKFSASAGIVTSSLCYLDMGWNVGFKADLPTTSLVDTDGNVQGNVKYSAGVINLYPSLGNISAPIADDDNIEVTFKAVDDEREGKANKVRMAQIGTIFGVQGADDRVFLADGTNKDVYSEAHNFSYFAEENTIEIGTAPIIGYLRLNDSTLAVLKSKDTQDATMYVRTGTYLNSTDDNGNIIKSVPIFSTMSTNTNVRAMGNICNVVLNNEPMFLTDEGMYAVQLSHNLATDERLLLSRSQPIKRGLQALELTDAVGIVHEDKLYVAQGGKCYVADKNFIYQQDNNTSYEWWAWDNIPARVFLSKDRQLYFGTNDGRVCVFENDYTDDFRQRMENASIIDGYPVASKVVQFSDIVASKIEKMKYFTPNVNVYRLVLTSSDYTFSGWTVKLGYGEDINRFYVGMILAMPKYQEYVIETNHVEVEVTKVDIANKSFDIKVISGDSWQVAKPYIFEVLKGKKQLIVDINKQNKTFVMLDKHGNGRWENIFFDYGKPQILTGTLEGDIPVKAYWDTAVTDLGACDLLKSLCDITVAVDPSSTSKLKVGYKTRRGGGELLPSNNAWDTDAGDFSFFDIDFNSFSFIPSANYSITKKVIARNFNYIKLRIESNDDKPCAMKQIVLRYKYSAKTRGVR